jgi:hypothetical protein
MLSSHGALRVSRALVRIYHARWAKSVPPHTARSELERRATAVAVSQAEACRFVLSRLADEAANVSFGAESGMKTSFDL